MTTTENSRVDALTDEQIRAAIDTAIAENGTGELLFTLARVVERTLAASPASQPAAAPTIKQRLGSGTDTGHYWMRRDDRWYVIQVKDGHYRHCGASADIPLQDALALPIIPIQEPYPAPSPAAEQVAIPAGWLNEDRMSEIARKCEIECQAIPGTNMWQCAHMAVEETLRALAEPHMSMLIAEVCEDADGYKHIEAVIEDLDDLPKGMKLYAAPQPPAQADARIDVEALLRACVPGGDICDPQRIADSIREWFDDHGAQADARVGLTAEQVVTIRSAARVLDDARWPNLANDLRALLQGANHV